MSQGGSPKRKVVEHAMTVAWGMYFTLKQNKLSLDVKLVPTALDALRLTRIHNAKTIEGYVKGKYGARYIARWIIEFVADKGRFTTYVESRLTGTSGQFSNEEIFTFTALMKKVAVELKAQLAATK